MDNFRFSVSEFILSPGANGAGVDKPGADAHGNYAQGQKVVVLSDAHGDDAFGRRGDGDGAEAVFDGYGEVFSGLS